MDHPEHTPGSCPVALLLVDVINSFDFPEAPDMMPRALEMAHRIALLKRRANAARVPVIYVNDNFGQWRSNLEQQVKHAVRATSRGRDVVKMLLPDSNDYFVLKPKHSGFFATTLDTLLRHLGTRSLVITGLATDICVYFTASDAYLRDYRLYVPRDCVAAHTPSNQEVALEQLARILKADTRPSGELRLEQLQRKAVDMDHRDAG